MNYNEASERVALAVRVALAERRESIRGLSEATDLPLSTLNRRLRGVSRFTIDEVESIAEYFGVRVDLFIQKNIVRAPDLLHTGAGVER